MKYFIDTATNKPVELDDSVIVTNNAGVYSFESSKGVPMNMPTTLQPCTQAQAYAILYPPIPLPKQAQAALDKVTGPSGQIMRCMAAGVAVPASWSAYVLALRNIVNGTDTISTSLPAQPAFVTGT